MKSLRMLCLSIVCLFVLTPFCGRRTPQSRKYPNANVILIVIDALRADHLGCYGYSRSTSPHLDRLAETGILFENMLANTSWTRPGAASILSGLYPKNHRAITPEDNLAEEITLLSEILKGKGYSCYGFVANHHAGQKAGFNQGYDEFYSFTETGGKHALQLTVDADEINGQIFQVLNRLKHGEKNFILIHYVDPHAPYTAKEKYFSKGDEIEFTVKTLLSLYRPPPESERRKKIIGQMINAYDDEILFNDKMIGRLMAALKSKHMFDNSLIVITSDHGEEFYDHGQLSHGRTLYDEQLRVPLLIHLPDRAAARIDKMANQVDIVPTLLSLLNIGCPVALDGMDLLDDSVQARKYSYAELSRNQYEFSSIQSRNEKFITGILRNRDKFDNLWFRMGAAIETNENNLQLCIQSLHQTREVEISCNLLPISTLSISPEKKMYHIQLPPGHDKKIITIRSLTPCQIPLELKIRDDPRCLSFQVLPSKHVSGNNLLGEHISEYYRLSEDVGEDNNQIGSKRHWADILDLIRHLHTYQSTLRNLTLTRKPVQFDKKQLRALKALGYF